MAVDSKRILLDLQQRPGNDTCADCSAKGKALNVLLNNDDLK